MQDGILTAVKFDHLIRDQYNLIKNKKDKTEDEEYII